MLTWECSGPDFCVKTITEQFLVQEVGWKARNVKWSAEVQHHACFEGIKKWMAAKLTFPAMLGARHQRNGHRVTKQNLSRGITRILSV